MLYETLTFSYSISDSITHLERMWNLDGKVTYEEKGKTFRMIIQQPVEMNQLNSVIKHIKSFLGYFPSHISTLTTNFKYDYKEMENLVNSRTKFAIHFDAKYDQEVEEKQFPSTLKELVTN